MDLGALYDLKLSPDLRYGSQTQVPHALIAIKQRLDGWEGI